MRRFCFRISPPRSGWASIGGTGNGWSGGAGTSSLAEDTRMCLSSRGRCTSPMSLKMATTTCITASSASLRWCTCPHIFFKVILALPTRNAQETLTLAPAPAAAKGAANADAGVLVPSGGWRSPERPIALGAFVVPNEPIDDSVDLSKFEVPIEIVERYSGLNLWPRLPRKASKHVATLCSATKCQLPPAFKNKGDDGKSKTRIELIE
mmetsp:Transcript_19039/g.37087  ORF Transcript_19039/g.37087 Transcript_19039/m.37087 type:complete len:208 (-) Transcript_19039:26-649(-)